MHKLSFTLVSHKMPFWRLEVPFMHDPYQLPEATSTTVVIEFVLSVDNLPSGVSCHVYFDFSKATTPQGGI